MSVEKEVFPFMARDKELYAMELQGNISDCYFDLNNNFNNGVGKHNRLIQTIVIEID